MKICNIGIIGCGNMSVSIMRALISETASGSFENNGIRLEVAVSDPDTAKLETVENPHIKTFTDNAELVKRSDIIIIAVKPQAALTALNGIDFDKKIVISIMAGITLNRLRMLLSASTDKIVRVMPNLNAKVGLSVNAYCHEGLNADEEKTIVSILGSFGHCYKVNESEMNYITGISGSGPAFVFMFIDAFIKKGLAYGFDASVSKNLALDTISGCIENVRNYDGDIVKLIDSVCSKGGTTIEGVRYLRDCDFENIVKQAIDNAEKRSAELEKTI